MLMFEELRQMTNRRRKMCQEFLNTIEASGESYALDSCLGWVAGGLGWAQNFQNLVECLFLAKPSPFC